MCHPVNSPAAETQNKLSFSMWAVRNRQEGVVLLTRLNSIVWIHKCSLRMTNLPDLSASMQPHSLRTRVTAPNLNQNSECSQRPHFFACVCQPGGHRTSWHLASAVAFLLGTLIARNSVYINVYAFYMRHNQKLDLAVGDGLA